MPEIEIPDANKCDFCSTPDPQWEYPARTFKSTALSIPSVLTINSIDEWHACDTCHGFIQAGKWAELALHANRCFGWKFPIEDIIVLHQEFRANWLGPVRRIEKKETKDGARTGDR